MLKTGRRVLSASTLFNTWRFLNTYLDPGFSICKPRSACRRDHAYHNTSDATREEA